MIYEFSLSKLRHQKRTFDRKYKAPISFAILKISLCRDSSSVTSCSINHAGCPIKFRTRYIKKSLQMEKGFFSGIFPWDFSKGFFHDILMGFFKGIFLRHVLWYFPRDFFNGIFKRFSRDFLSMDFSIGYF